MKELIKSCNELHKSIILISGLLLVVSFSTKDTKVYERALAEIRIIGENGIDDLYATMSNYWVKEPEVFGVESSWGHKAGENYFETAVWESMQILKVKVDKNDELKYPSFGVRYWEHSDIYLELPPIGSANIRTTINYLEKDSLRGEIYFLPAEASWVFHHVEREARKENFQLENSTLEFIELISDNVGKGHLKSYDKRPFNTTEIGLFNFMFSSEKNRKWLTQIKVPLNMSRKPVIISRDDWHKIQCEWYKRKGVECILPLDGSRFKSLKELIGEIGDMDVSKAISWLETKKNQNESSVVILGISIKRELITIFAPIILLILLFQFLNLITHMVRNISERVFQLDTETYWGIISPMKSHRFINLLSLSLLPILTTIYTQIKLGFNAYSIIVSVLMVVVTFKIISTANKIQLTHFQTKKMDNES